MYYCALLASSGGILALFTWKLLKFLCSVQVENKLYGAQLLKSARSLLVLECLSISCILILINNCCYLLIKAVCFSRRFIWMVDDNFCMQSSSERRKLCRLKAERHYEIAFKSFIGLSDVCCLDPLRVQLERVALCEYQLSSKSLMISCFLFPLLCTTFS